MTTDIELLIQGDMQGDKIIIRDSHRMRAAALFEQVNALPAKSVLSIGGASGSGKSEIAALLGTAFIQNHRGAYVLSCDNYPLRPPRENDAERERLFHEGGEKALHSYLGTSNEIDFDRLEQIVSQFKAGAPTIPLRVMDATKSQVANDDREQIFSTVDILILEGTWSNLVKEVDCRIFLKTTFEETLAHREARGRDPISEFGERVLRIEQGKLDQIGEQATIIALLDGTLDVRKPLKGGLQCELESSSAELWNPGVGDVITATTAVSAEHQSATLKK